MAAATMPLPNLPVVRALHAWLDTWRGSGDIEAGMAPQGYDLQLTRHAAEGWRATFFITGREHSPLWYTGAAWEKAPWLAVQKAAREALSRA